MKEKITKLLFAGIASLLSIQVQAQHSIGLQTGNHNAPYSAFLNPANTYPDKDRLYFNVWGAGFGVTNNFLNYNAPFGIFQWATGNQPDVYKGKFDQKWLTLTGADLNKLYYLNEVYGPSVFFRVTPRTAIGFGVRGISGMSIDGLNSNMAKLFRYGLDTSASAFGPGGLKVGQQYSSGRFSVNVSNYQEWFLSVSKVTKDRGRHFTKWGVTGKILIGMGAAQLGADNFDFKVTNTDKVEFSKLTSTFYHTNDNSAATSLDNVLGLNFQEVNGGGAGVDVGFVYENRKDKMRKTVGDYWWNCGEEYRNEYRWKFGASLTDLGLLVYKGNARMLNTSDPLTWNINRSLIDNEDYKNGLGYDRFEKIDTGFYDALGADQNNGFGITTPAALNANFDVNMGGGFYTSINWTQSLKGVYSMGLKKSSYLNVTPRYESEFAEVGLPITLTRDYRQLNVGLYGRLGPVIIGTDNLGGLAKAITNSTYSSANVYFGFRFQLPVCGWRDYEYDSIQRTDTVYKEEEAGFWNHDTIKTKDTVIQIKKDTIIRKVVVRDTVKVIVRDTVVKYRNKEVSGGDISAREAELKKKEDDLKKREEEIKRQEAIIREKNNTTMSTDPNCKTRIAELEDQLRRERDLYSKLNTQLQDCRNDKVKAEDKIKVLEAEIVKLKAENTTVKTENSNLKIEIDNLKKEIGRLKLNNQPCEKQTKTLDSLLLVERNANSQLNKEISRQKAEITAKQSEIDGLKKRIGELETENSTQKAKVTALEKDLQTEKDKNAALDKQLKDLRTEYDFEIQKVKKLEEQLKNCGSADEAVRLKAELEAQKKRCDELDVKVKSLEKENSDLKAKVSGVEKELADTKGKLTVADAKIAELELKLKNCGNSEETVKLQAEIETLKKQNSEKDAQITALKNDKSKLESDLSAAKSKITSLEDELKKCKESGSCDEVKLELDELKAKYSSLQGQYNVLKEEYNYLLSERNDLKSKLSTCEQKLKESSSSEDVYALKAEITKLKGTITQLNGEIDAKQKSLDALQESYSTLEAENATQKKNIADLQKQIAGFKAQLNELQNKLKECEEKAAQQPAEGGLLKP